MAGYEKTWRRWLTAAATAAALGSCAAPRGHDQDLADAQAFAQADRQAAVAAVADILAQNESRRIDNLAKRLVSDKHQQTAHNIVAGLAQSEHRPPPLFVAPLLKRMGWFARDDVPPGVDYAAALGRSMDIETAPKVIALAKSWLAPVRKRTLATESLGYYVHPTSADALLELIRGKQPPPVRDAAGAALAQLSGEQRYARDVDKWRAWHRRLADLTSEAWLQAVIEQRHHHQQGRADVAQQESAAKLAAAIAKGDATAVQLGTAFQRLVDFQEKLYRATPQPQRQALLVQWLSMEQAQVRQKAVELAKLRDTADEALREALRQRLADPLAEIRHDATLVLWRLSDEPAARVAADHLVKDSEPELKVQKALLLMISGMPQAKAVAPAMARLADPQLRPEAAAALTAAIDQGMTTAQQRSELAREVAELLEQLPLIHLPEPQIVALLGRVADEQDWKRIAYWLDAEDEKVKEAAANALANSDRSLLPLALRADDKHIQRIVIKAARQRGRDPATLLALIDHKPADDRIAAQWQLALQAMAPRVPVEALVNADDKLVRLQQNGTLREGLLTAAINPLLEQPAQVQVDQARVLTELLMRRASIRLNGGEPQAAITDLVQIEKLAVAKLDSPLAYRVAIIRLTARLALGEFEPAQDQAQALLTGTPADRLKQVRLDIAKAYLNTAQRHIDGDQSARAVEVLARLRQLMGQSLPAQVESRFNDLQGRASQADDAETDPDSK